ncbi:MULTISPECIES: hypothetical protein [Pseudomonas]|uniref:hypothetical protein n=1 Tax=Pseudomonas sp. TSPC2-1 TaxID=2804663 RepID=UPI003CF8F21A
MQRLQGLLEQLELQPQALEQPAQVALQLEQAQRQGSVVVALGPTQGPRLMQRQQAEQLVVQKAQRLELRAQPLLRVPQVERWGRPRGLPEQ